MYFKIPVLNYGKKMSTIDRISKLSNENSQWLDIYNMSLPSLKRVSKIVLRYE